MTEEVLEVIGLHISLEVVIEFVDLRQVRLLSCK